MDELSREMVVRRYLLGQTSEEIARGFDTSAAAVRMRLMRIRSERAAPHGSTSASDEANAELDVDSPPASETRPCRTPGKSQVNARAR